MPFIKKKVNEETTNDLIIIKKGLFYFVFSIKDKDVQIGERQTNNIKRIKSGMLIW